MRVLPTAKREAMFAIYAFCREVDDVADEPAPLEDKKRRLGAEAVEPKRPTFKKFAR